MSVSATERCLRGQMENRTPSCSIHYILSLTLAEVFIEVLLQGLLGCIQRSA